MPPKSSYAASTNFRHFLLSDVLRDRLAWILVG